jgi:hypothetical protein
MSSSSSCSAIRKAISFLIALPVVVLAGCHDAPKKIWSAESKSPDGMWAADAYTLVYTGPGLDGVETRVEITRFDGAGGHIQVLGFMNGGGDMDLKMSWSAPSRLDVTYKDDPKMLYFQVVKTSGVEISVKDLRE